MNSTELLAYVLSIGMGLTLGVFGGGGSILTLPILVYVLEIEPVLATSYSLFVVGTTALAGAIQKARKKAVNYKVALYVALPSILSIYLTRRYLLPSIPDEILNLNGWILTKNVMLMLLFAAIMFMASYSMIRKLKLKRHKSDDINYPLIIIDGLILGLVSGMVGAGGGFLIVPALVVLVGLHMKTAIATSLLIISMNSLIGVSGDLMRGQTMDWQFLLVFTMLAIGGLFIGLGIAKKLQADKLKSSFGWFILIMAVLVLVKELFV